MTRFDLLSLLVAFTLSCFMPDWGAQLSLPQVGYAPLLAQEPGKDEETSEEDEEDEEKDELDGLLSMKAITVKEKAAPRFIVKLRKESELDFFPCQDCHEEEEPNLRVRELEEEHEDIELTHGDQQFWCLTCHLSGNLDHLRSLEDRGIDFDRSYRLCGQCHFQRHNDWLFGVHGKRVGNWRGERNLYLCTECHDPHSPAIEAIPPNPPPKVRKGLHYRPTNTEKHLKAWEKKLVLTDVKTDE